jgi:hypothetical protein
MTKWHSFAERELPRVVRALGLPAAHPARDPNLTECPRHGTPIGPVGRICLDCHTEAWAELGRRYASAEHGRGKKPRRARQPTLPGLRVENSNPEEEPMQHDQPTTSETLAIIDHDVEHGHELAELVERPPPPATLFGADPERALARIVKVADKLAHTIRAQKLAVRISGGEHVLVEGWTLLGTLLGVYPVLVWSRKLDDGWEARVEARTLDGRIVGAAESECLRTERKWANADDYAVRSMAATRATSKALRQPLGFVMSLAGFDVTPAEEVPAGEQSRTTPTMHVPERDEGPVPGEIKPTKDQITAIQRLVAALQDVDPDTDWTDRAREIAGVPGRLLTHAGADGLIEKLQGELAAKNEAAA